VQDFKFFHITNIESIDLDQLNIEYVLWDLDGTLYLIEDIVSMIKKSLIFNPLNLLEILNFKKTENIISKQRLNNSFDLTTIKNNFERMQLFINKFITNDLLHKESAQLLQIFNKKQIKQICVSEYPIADKLDRLGIKHYFKASHSSPDDYFHWKPNPLMAKKLLDQYDLRKGFIIIGDRVDTDGALFDNLMNFINS